MRIRRIGFPIIASAFAILILCLLLSLRPALSGVSSLGHYYSREVDSIIVINSWKLAGKAGRYSSIIVLFPDAIMECTEKYKIAFRPPVKFKAYILKSILSMNITQILNLTRADLIALEHEKYFHKVLSREQLNQFLHTMRFSEAITCHGELTLAEDDFSAILLVLEENVTKLHFNEEIEFELKVNLFKAYPRIVLVAGLGLAIALADIYRERRSRIGL